MLQITIPPVDLWDESKEEFVKFKGQTLNLEHSLVSLSKWESRWCKPFLSKTPKTREETLDYIKCMTITQNVDPDAYNYLDENHFKQINDYIEAPMTATFLSDDKMSRQGGGEVVTSELIYYWMIALNIPPEYQKWHLNRLIMLVRVCNIKNQPPKKRSRRELMSRNTALNNARRKQLNSRG